jgi:hypothetical protein
MPTHQSLLTPQSLLERYVEAKDMVRPELMKEIYADDAVLTFSIATETISFPPRVVGINGITKTLVVDFAAKYSRCKTFYVCDSTACASVRAFTGGRSSEKGRTLYKLARCTSTLKEWTRSTTLRVTFSKPLNRCCPIPGCLRRCCAQGSRVLSTPPPRLPS